MNCMYLNNKCKCEILNKVDCKKCKFKKTEEQYNEELNKVQEYMFKNNLERVIENGKVKFRSIRR